MLRRQEAALDPSSEADNISQRRGALASDVDVGELHVALDLQRVDLVEAVEAVVEIEQGLPVDIHLELVAPGADRDLANEKRDAVRRRSRRRARPAPDRTVLTSKNWPSTKGFMLRAVSSAPQLPLSMLFLTRTPSLTLWVKWKGISRVLLAMKLMLILQRAQR